MTGKISTDEAWNRVRKRPIGREEFDHKIRKILETTIQLTQMRNVGMATYSKAYQVMSIKHIFMVHELKKQFGIPSFAQPHKLKTREGQLRLVLASAHEEMFKRQLWFCTNWAKDNDELVKVYELYMNGAIAFMDKLMDAFDEGANYFEIMRRLNLALDTFERKLAEDQPWLQES